MAKINRKDHIWFVFSAVGIINILNENTDIFGRSQGPAALPFLIQQSYMTYKCENGQNDRHGRSSDNLFIFLRKQFTDRTALN